MKLNYLIFRGKQKTKTPEYKVPPHFQWSEQQALKEAGFQLAAPRLHLVQSKAALMRL